MGIEVNKAGTANCAARIKAGDVDKASAWSFSAEDGDALLGAGGDDWTNYAKWHMAEDTSAAEKTKARYKYPFGKGGKVYRSGLIAAKQRAAQQGATAIADACDEYIDQIDGTKEPDGDKNAFSGSIERRVMTFDHLHIERREGASPRIMGHAAVFNQWADIGGMFREKIVPGAFARAIGSQDVRALFNHDPNIVLGRNRAKPTPTLSLSEDATGLRYEVIPPDTQAARDLLVSIERGDVSQGSFGFSASPTGQNWDWNADIPERTLTDVNLYDVSPVTFPAYEGTDVAVRQIEAWRKAFPPGVTIPQNNTALRRQLAQRARQHGY